MSENNDIIQPSNPFEDIEPPKTPDGHPMHRFEVKMRKGKNGNLEKAVFIGGEYLDWSIDVASLMEAMQMGPKFYREIQKDIARHYTESVSEFIGRRVTADDIKKATKTGWI
jgi:hypothetical protein